MQLKNNEIQELYKRAVAYSVRYGFSYQDAEDIAQNSLMRFMASGYDESKKILPYFYMIVRNSSLDLHRKSVRLQRIRDSIPICEIAPEAEPESAEIELFSVTKENRQLIKMRLDGLSWNEIAAKLNKPAANLRKAYERAMRTLRTIHTS